VLRYSDCIHSLLYFSVILMTTAIEEEEVEVVDIDMGDAAKENLRI
jgi:hypothetical protein